jgi:hypothetical protein
MPILGRIISSKRIPRPISDLQSTNRLWMLADLGQPTQFRIVVHPAALGGRLLAVSFRCYQLHTGMDHVGNEISSAWPFNATVLKRQSLFGRIVSTKL